MPRSRPAPPRRPLLTRVVGLAAVPALLLAACGGQQGSESAASNPSEAAAAGCEVSTDTRISIATGNATGVYFALGGALAEQLPDATGGRVRANAAETGASVQNIEQLVAGDFQIAFSTADTAADAVAGTGPFTEPQPIGALARLYDNTVHVVARKDAGIATVADLAGKAVSTGSPKSGTELFANRLLDVAGIASAVNAQRLDLTKTVEGMKDGTVDAMIWSGGLPTPAVLDLVTTAGDDVVFLDVSEYLPRLQEQNASYAAATIPAEVYGTPAAVPAVTVPNLLVARDDVDSALACQITSVLLERRDQLVQVNGAAEGITAKTAPDTDPTPLLPGARLAIDKAASAGAGS